MTTVESGRDVDLSRFDDDYRSVQVERPQPAQTQMRFGIPDGRYKVRVENVELTVAKSSGNPMLRYRMRIMVGPFESRLIVKNRAITSATIEYVKKELDTCGLELEPFSNLPMRLGDLTNMELEIAKVTKGDYENIYFNKRLSALPGYTNDPGPLGPDGRIVLAADEIDRDDIPF